MVNSLTRSQVFKLLRKSCLKNWYRKLAYNCYLISYRIFKMCFNNIKAKPLKFKVQVGKLWKECKKVNRTQTGILYLFYNRRPISRMNITIYIDIICHYVGNIIFYNVEGFLDNNELKMIKLL